MSELATRESTTSPPIPAAMVKSVIAFKSVDEVLQLARTLFAGGVAPTNVDRPEKLVPIILAGLEVGLGVMQSCKAIMMQNGQPSIWGDAGLALVRQSGKLVPGTFKEFVEGEGDERAAVCELQRLGEKVKQFRFAMSQAKKLASFRKAKEGMPWLTDPDNMLRFRALWRALRSEFPDVLCGLSSADESEDIVTAEVTVRQTGTPTPTAQVDPTRSASPNGNVEVDLMITEEQKKELLFLHNSYMTAKNINEPAEKKTAWVALLAPYSVDSMSKLTAAQADKFIDSLAKEHGFPPFSPRAKAA